VTGRRIPGWIRGAAGALWAGGLGLYAAVLAQTDSPTTGWVEATGVAALCVGFGVIGILLTIRRPRHLIGWLLVAFAVVFSVRLGVEEWANWRYSTDGAFDPRLAVVVINVTATLSFIPLVLLMAVFPADRLPSGRWRTALYFAIAAIGSGVLVAPFHGDALPAPVPGHEAAADGIAFLAMLPVLAMFVILPLRLGWLLFRGDPVERRQVRWVAYVFAVVLGLLALTPVVPDANRVAGLVAGPGIPAAIAVAITRYRLYEIDRVISRTVSYAVVAGCLALLFAVGTVGLSQLLPEGSSSLAVAATTLAAAAVAGPLLRRVQAVVDARFHRLPYDAATVTDDLAVHLRGVTDPVDVVEGWLRAVGGAVRPATQSVWVAQSRNDSGTERR
jgi:hypothetical protein